METMIIRYFSATGNSRYMALEIADHAGKSGWNVDCKSIEEANVQVPVLKGETVVLVSPVLGFAPVTFMIDYAKKMPAGSGCIYLVTLCGAMMGKKGVSKGYPGGSFVLLESILTSKGYTISGTAAISLPDNFTQVFNPPSLNECTAIFKEATTEIDTVCSNIAGKRLFRFQMSKTVETIFRLGSPLFLQLGRFGLKHLFIADRTCTGCGVCARNCPAKTIVIDHKYPVWENGCSGCGRCINICPHKSIQTSLFRLITSAVLPTIALVSIAWLLSLYALNLGMGLIAATGISCMLVLLLIIPINRIYMAIAEVIFTLLERNNWIRSFSSISYTKKYNRYKASEIIEK